MFWWRTQTVNSFFGIGRRNYLSFGHILYEFFFFAYWKLTKNHWKRIFEKKICSYFDQKTASRKENCVQNHKSNFSRVTTVLNSYAKICTEKYLFNANNFDYKKFIIYLHDSVVLQNIAFYFGHKPKIFVVECWLIDSVDTTRFKKTGCVIRSNKYRTALFADRWRAWP